LSITTNSLSYIYAIIKYNITIGDKMKKLNIVLLTIASIGLIGITGCATKAENGALIGAGTGALLGQAIGGNTGSTVIGAGVGAIAGAAIGENEDKKDRQRYGY
jgi:outer membrane lipoprotein SlyB